MSETSITHVETLLLDDFGHAGVAVELGGCTGGANK